MQNETPHLVYTFPSFYPKDEIEKELETFKNIDINILAHKNEEGSMYNAFEWIIPSAFGVYILKPYFDSFLTEAGKDHYELLKKFISEYLKKGKEFNYSLIVAKESTEKLSKKYNNSLSVSLELQTKNNRIIKVLFDNSLSIEEWQKASNKILDLFSNHYEKYPDDNLTQAINQFENRPHRKLYIIINKNNNPLDINDDTKMVEIYKNK